jgi:hypothetical protein
MFYITFNVLPYLGDASGLRKAQCRDYLAAYLKLGKWRRREQCGAYLWVLMALRAFATAAFTT